MKISAGLGVQNIQVLILTPTSDLDKFLHLSAQFPFPPVKL